MSANPPPPAAAVRGFRAPRLPEKQAAAATAATSTQQAASALHSPSATPANPNATSTAAATSATASTSSGSTVSQLRSNLFLAANRAASNSGSGSGGSGHYPHSSSSSLKSNPFLAADKKNAAGTPKATAAGASSSTPSVVASAGSKPAAVAPAPSASPAAPTRPPPPVAAASLRSNPFLAADRIAAGSGSGCAVTTPKAPTGPATAAPAPPTAAAAKPSVQSATKPPAPSAAPPAQPASNAAAKTTQPTPPAPAAASRSAASVPSPATSAALASVAAPTSPNAVQAASVPAATAAVTTSPSNTAAAASPSSTSSPSDMTEDVWAMSNLPVVTRSPSTGSRTCHACKGAIYDAVFVAAADRFFHKHHFSCSLCQTALTQSSFQSAADGELLLCESCAGNCKSCFVCTQLVVSAKGQPQVVSLNATAGTVCHFGCFACASCAKPLSGVPMFTAVATHKLYCEPCAQPFMPTGFDCVACGEPICGRVLLALENHWHPACFCCADSTCLAPLETLPFLVDEASNSVYCRPHYEALFSPKCSVCTLPLSSASADGAGSSADPGVALANAPHIRMHAGCMRCVQCHTLLQPSAFHQDPDDLGTLYCTAHFEESFAERCDVCSKPIPGAQTPLRVQDKIMHQACFACAECGRSLATCAYAEKQGKLVCEKHAAAPAPAPAPAAKSAPLASPAKQQHTVTFAPVVSVAAPIPTAAASSAAAAGKPTAAPASGASTPAPAPAAPAAPASTAAAPAPAPIAPAATAAAAPANRSTPSIQDRIRALQAQQQQQQPSAAAPTAAAVPSPSARGVAPAQKAVGATPAAAVPSTASPKATPTSSAAASSAVPLASVPESTSSAASAAPVPVATTTAAPVSTTAPMAVPPADLAHSDDSDDDDCEPPPPPPMAAAPVQPAATAGAAAESSPAPVVAVAAVGAVAAVAVATPSSTESAPNATVVAPAVSTASAPADRPASLEPIRDTPLAVAVPPDAAAVTPSDLSPVSTAADADDDDGAPGIEIEEGVSIESQTRRRGVASVNKTGAPPPFKPPPPLGSMTRMATPPPSAAPAVAAPVAPAAPYVVQLVNGDIPPSALGPFISKGIEAAVLQSASHRSKSTQALDKKGGGDFARKDLYALQHGGVSYTMLDYAPQTFAKIRKHFGISQSSYLKSLVGAVAEAAAAGAGAPAASASSASAVPESASAPGAIRGGAVGDGKSGMLFFFSSDGRYVLKTVKRDEVSFFRRILRHYTEHITLHHTHTLLPRFFSMHKVMYTTRSYTAAQSHDGTAGPGGESRTFRLICMNNLFDVAGPPVDDLCIAHRFDLKGSTRNRRIDASQIKPGRVLLDLNFQEQGFKLHLGGVQKSTFMAQLRADADFLTKVNAMDHSLLLGIHMDDDEALERWGPRSQPVDAQAVKGPLLHDTQRFTADAGLVSVWQRHRGGVRAFESGNADAAAGGVANGAGSVGSVAAAAIPRREVYFLGIIDILQEFNTTKALESAYKRVRYNKNAISAIESRGYNQRFVSYIESVIV